MKKNQSPVCGIGPIPEELKTLPRLSPTALAEFLESPAHYAAYRDRKKETTKAMEEGTIIHMACLEPEKFDSLYLPTPSKGSIPNMVYTIDDIKAELKSRGVEFKSSLKKSEFTELLAIHAPEIQVWDDYIEKYSAGRELISADLFEACMTLRKKLAARPFESKFLEAATKEQYLWWLHHSGVIISMKADAFATGLGKDGQINAVADIKKVQSVNTRAIGYEMMDSYNPMKAALYADGLSKIFGVQFNYFCFIYVTAKVPYSIKNITLNEGQLDAGRQLYEAAIEAWLNCYHNDYWPDECEEVVNWTEPAYFFGSTENEIARLTEFTARVDRKFKTKE